jgi:hypothetical protein
MGDNCTAVGALKRPFDTPQGERSDETYRAKR